MARCRGFGRCKPAGLDALRLVGRENLVKSCGAPLVLDSRRELVHEKVVYEVSFRG